MVEAGTAEFLRQYELCQFLKFARSRVDPDVAGISSGGQRRVKGLRRDEVAALCNVSVAWYTWFETARPGTNVSARFIRAVARALRLSDDETVYLFSLAIPEMPKAPCPLRSPICILLGCIKDSFSSLTLSEIAQRLPACDTLPVGIYCTRPDGTIVYANESLFRLLGYSSRSEYMRLNVGRDLYCRPDERTAWQREIERSRSVLDATCAVRRSDGAVIQVRDSAYAVTTVDSSVPCYFGTWEGSTSSRRFSLSPFGSYEPAFESRLEERIA
jgi:PAS domain S-box-containing protein